MYNREVERQRILFKDMQDQMDEVRQQTKMERRERAKAAFKVSEGIAKEREGLVHQLHHLKEVNQNMMDQQVSIKSFLNVPYIYITLKKSLYTITSKYSCNNFYLL